MSACPGRHAQTWRSLHGAQLGAALRGGRVVDLRGLAIAQGRAAWLAYLDLYVLDADGGLYDAALLAALAALAALRLPSVAVDDAGKASGVLQGWCSWSHRGRAPWAWMYICRHCMRRWPSRGMRGSWRRSRAGCS